jgi:DNA-binding GntR family transcriptional regulator
MRFMALKQKQLAYTHIRKKILLGKVAMGSRLSEEALAGEIGVSRTPVREALNQLGAEGLLNLVPNHGAFVQKLGRRDVRELYQLRVMLEGYTANEATTRVTPEQLEQLQHLCDRMHEMCHQLRESGKNDFSDESREQWVLIDVAFHLLVVDIAASPRTAKIISDLRLLTQICGHLWINPQDYRSKWYYLTWADHLRIVRAMRRRDGAAATRHIARHISGAMEGVLRNFAFNEAESDIPDLPESIRRTIGRMERFTHSSQKGAFL